MIELFLFWPLIYFFQSLQDSSCTQCHIFMHFVHLAFLYMHYFCKVEFNQPSCWLYSMPNLLVFQHLVTLYLGGIVVRVVSEIVCKKTKTRDWISQVTRGCKPREDAHVPGMSEVEASCQLEHYRTKQNNWPFCYLVAGSHDSVKPRGQAASQPCFEKLDSSHSIITPI